MRGRESSSKIQWQIKTEELTNFVKINKEIGKSECLEYKLTNINIVAIILFVLIS